MKKSFILSAIMLSLVLLITSCSNSGDTPAKKPEKGKLPQSFSYLKTLDLKAGGDGVFVHYNPEFTEVIDEEIKEGDPLFFMPGGNQLVMKTKISKADKQKHTVVFTMGPSADPAFIFYKGDKEIGRIAGLELYVPGNGSIYVSGHTNNMYDQRKKFIVQNGQIKEAHQPYYYVGLSTTTTKPIKLYHNKSYKRELASLPKGAEIEVLINEGHDYLVRTSFGLTGWVKISTPTQTGIDGLFYAGD